MKCTALTILEVVSFPQCNDPMFQECTLRWQIFKCGCKHNATLHLSQWNFV